MAAGDFSSRAAITERFHHGFTGCDQGHDRAGLPIGVGVSRPVRRGASMGVRHRVDHVWGWSVRIREVRRGAYAAPEAWAVHAVWVRDA